MTTPLPQHRLRLVGGDESPRPASRAQAARVREVARENRLAAGAGLSPSDPRWVLAARTYGQLQGAQLSPDRRARLMRTAAMLGVRPFEANMVIALVQDKARQGRPLAEAQPMLEMIDPPSPQRSPAWVRWVAVAAGAGAVFLVLARWILAA